MYIEYVLNSALYAKLATIFFKVGQLGTIDFDLVGYPCRCHSWFIWYINSIDWFEGKKYRKIPYLMGTYMVSCRFSLKIRNRW